MSRRHPSLGTSGQSSLEYLGLVLLVVVGLGTAGSVAAGPALANAVGRQMRHALCVVSGGGCLAVDPQPCLMRTLTVRGTVSAKIALLKLGRGMALLRFERSDGSVDLTLLDELSAGVQAELGAKAHISLGERQLNEGGAAEAQLVATLGGGRTWRVGSVEAADALQHRLEEVVAGRLADHVPGAGRLLRLGQKVFHVGEGQRLPPPRSHTVRGRLDAKLELALGPVATVRGEGGALLGVEQLADKSHVVTLTLDGRLTALLAAKFRAFQVQGIGTLSVTFDPSARPVSATLTTIGSTTDGYSGSPGRLSGANLDGRQVRIDRRLDLSTTDNGTAISGLLRAMRHPETDLVEAGEKLGERFDTDGETTVGLYRSRQTAFGVGGEVAVGVALGLNADLTDDGAHLTGARTRPPGGAWEPRLDCA